MQILAHILDIYWLVSIPLAAISWAVLVHKKPSTNPRTQGTEKNTNP